MAKEKLPDTGRLACVFNLGQTQADTLTQKPWRRAELMARAEVEFRRLHGLKPAG